VNLEVENEKDIRKITQLLGM